MSVILGLTASQSANVANITGYDTGHRAPPTQRSDSVTISVCVSWWGGRLWGKAVNHGLNVEPLVLQLGCTAPTVLLKRACQSKPCWSPCNATSAISACRAQTHRRRVSCVSSRTSSHWTRWEGWGRGFSAPAVIQRGHTVESL